MRKTTLLFLIDRDKVLLAMKKKGFGVGKMNGVGGKMQEGETIEEAACREAREEIGVSIRLSSLEPRGSLKFYFKNVPEWNQHVHIFVAQNWEGIPSESDEMNPVWHTVDTLPFAMMWQDDPHWLPLVLSGESIEGEFNFDEHGKILTEFSVRTISS